MFHGLSWMSFAFFNCLSAYQVFAGIEWQSSFRGSFALLDFPTQSTRNAYDQLCWPQLHLFGGGGGGGGGGGDVDSLPPHCRPRLSGWLHKVVPFERVVLLIVSWKLQL